MKKQKGFTLIELMIAMTIIAILATAGLQAYTNYVKRWRDTARAETARDLNSSVMAYAANNKGIPPADTSAFNAFLSTASETLSGSNIEVSNGVLVKDPVGGKPVCLDANWNANQPCAFHYTAYDDGTYAISYGVEHISSTEENFYKTTNSIAALTETTQKVPAAQATMTKYGVYTWSAKFIGQPATVSNGTTNDGVDETYTPPGSNTPTPLVVSFRSIRVDAPVGGGGGEWPATISVGSNNWMTIDLPWYYQWNRKTAGWSAGWAGNGPESEYGDPCPTGFHTPTSGDLGELDEGDITTLGLTMNGYLDSYGGSLFDQGSYGYYWSSDSPGAGASSLAFDSDTMGMYDNNHTFGFSVRCLQD